MGSYGRGGALALCVALFATPFFSHAAQIVFSPATGSFEVGKEFTVTLTLDPAGAKVNAGDATISFDPAFLSVAKLSKEGSVFSLWTAEPSFSNASGEIVLSGGSPSAVASQGTILVATFKPLKTGPTTLMVSKGSLLAADGKGTDVYTKGSDASFTIIEATAAPEEEEASVEGGSGLPIKPAISSPTHPKEAEWYALDKAEYAWKITDDVTSIRTSFSENKEEKPTTTVSPSVLSKTEEGLTDGTWYASVQFRNDEGWGEVAQRAFLIDTTPPEEFALSFDESSGTPLFRFETTDSTSGMARYEILFGETVATTLKPGDLVAGGAPVPPQPGGLTRVAVRAYDAANNMREASGEFTLPAVVKKGKGEEEVEKPPFFTIERILLILFAMALGGLLTWNMHLRKGSLRERMRILAEVATLRDKNDKIFSALREEFEQMVHDLDERPQLTPRERDFLEKLTEAFDIAEELFDSGMEELKKTVRGQ
jgi:hypothetical protein